MKIPQSPPSLPELIARYRDQLIEITSSPVQTSGKFLHWDKLRHLAPPTGWNHEQWWLKLKMSRLGQRSLLPFNDLHGRPFSYTLPDSVLERLHHIDSLGTGLIAMDAAVATTEARDRFIFNSLVEEAITSSQLEGASTTRQVAADMIREHRRPRDLSERMILNNYRTMESVREMQAHQLDLDALLNLHRSLTQDTLRDPGAAGRIQHDDETRVDVVDHASQRLLYTPPPAAELPERVRTLIRFANRENRPGDFLHPVVHAIILHFMLAWLHPFADGNGRTARALFYWAMLRHRYWLFEFISISRVIKQAPAKYARAFLYSETDENDLTYFLVHQLDVIGQALDELQAYLKRKSDQLADVEQQLKHSHFNHRQLALLSHALRHPGHRYSIKSHQTSHRTAYATARADLLQLAEAGLLSQSRIGKKTLIFIAEADLSARLNGQ